MKRLLPFIALSSSRYVQWGWRLLVAMSVLLGNARALATEYYYIDGANSFVGIPGTFPSPWEPAALVIGDRGTGVLVVDLNATVKSIYDPTFMGRYSTGNGRVEVRNGSTWRTNAIQTGAGQAYVNLDTGGHLTVDNDINFFTESGGYSRLYAKGGSSFSTDVITLGQNGAAALWMEGGATGTIRDLVMATGTGSSDVKLDGAGTALTLTRDFSATSSSPMSYSVQITNGATLTSRLDLGSDAADTASILIGSGGSWNISSGTLNLKGSSSSMSITSGGLFSGTYATVRSLLISGANSRMQLSGMMEIGATDNAAGSVIVENGGSLSAFNISLALGKGAGASVPLSLFVTGANSLLSASNVLDIGKYEPGVLTVENGGQVTAPSIDMAGRYQTQVGGPYSYGQGTIYLKGTASGRGVIETQQIESSYGIRAKVYFDGGILRAKADTSNLLSSFGENDLTIESGGLFLDTNGHYAEINSSLYGTGGLTKSGAGQLRFDVSHYYTGATSISAGTVTISDGVRLASRDFSLNGDGFLEMLGEGISMTSLSGSGGRLSLASGTLLLQQEVDTTAGVAFEGSWSLLTMGSGELILTGDSSSFTGGIQIGNRITLANAKALGTSNRVYLYGTLKNTVGMALNHTVSLDNTDAPATIDTAAFLTLNNPLTGVGSLNKAGNAILTLIGNQTYTGATTIKAGTLKLQDGSLASSSTTIEAGRLLFTGTGSYGGAVSGAGSLEREGSGTFIYTGAATHTGGTVVNGGTFQIGTGGTVGSIGGAISLLNGGTFVVNRNNTASTLTLGGAITGAGNFTLTSGLVVLSGTNTFTGNLTINGGTLGVGSNSSLGETLAAASRPKIILNGGGIRADGSARTIVNAVDMNGTFTLGRLTNLSGVNTLTGNSTIVSANTGTSAATTSTLAAIGQSGGARSLTFTEGSFPIGTIILSGDNTYTGGTNITGGTVALGASDRLANTGALSIGGGIFSMGSYNETVGAFSISSGSVTGSGTLTASSFGLTGGSVAANLAGTGAALTKSGSGTATLSGTNIYTGGSIISNGTLSLGSAGALGTTGAITMSGGTLQFTSANKQDYSGRLSAASQQYKFDTNGQDVTFANALTSAGGTLTKSGSGLLLLSAGGAYSGSTTISGGTFRLGAALDSATTVNLTSSGAAFDVNRITQSLGSLAGVSGSLVYLGDSALTIGSANTDTTFAGNLGDSGGASTATGGRLIKTGIGTTTFTGTNTHSGGTTINAGKLAVSGDTALGTGSVTINGGALGNTTDFISTKTITLGTYGGTIDAANGFMTFSNPFAASTGGLTKTGSRILTLTGAQGYTGATSVTGGILKIQSGSLASSGVTVSDGAKLSFGGTGSYAGNISGAGIFERGGGGTTVYTGAATHTGGTSVGDGTLQLGNGTTNGSVSGAISISSGATLAVNRIGADVSMANVFSGAGTFQKDGAGSVIVTNDNTDFTGSITLNAGTLGIGNNGAFGTARITINGGTIRATGAARSISNALTINGDFSLGRATEFSGGVTLGNNITITATNPGAGSDEASTFSGAIGGAGRSLTFVAGANPAGGIVLSGDNTYTGGTNINGGTVALGASDRLANTGALSIGGGIFSMGSYNETVGAFSISSGSVTGSGALTASSFSVTGGSVAANLAGSGVALTKSGTGTATLSGANTYTGGTLVNNGTLALGASERLANTGALTVAGGTFQMDAYDETVGAFSISSGSVTGSGTLTASSFSVTGGSVAANLAGSGVALIKSGTGTAMLSGANTYTGGTLVNNGTLALGASERLANTGALTVDGGTFQMDAYDETVGAFSMSSGSVSGTGRLSASSFAISGGSVAVNLGGSGALTKSGVGSVTLSGTNNYTGGTVLSAGTLSLGSADALGTSGTVSMNGGTLQFTSANKVDYSARLFTAAGQQFKFDTNGQDVVFGTKLASQDSALTKLGAGALTLAAGNLGSGATTISGGTLRLTQTEAAAMRLEADLGVTTNSGGAVTGWADQSGNGNNATALFGNVTVGTLTGGATALSFDSAGLSTPLSSTGTAYTIFSVVQTTTSAGIKSILGSTVNGNLQFRLGGLGVEVLEQGIEVLGSTGAVLDINQPALVATTVSAGGAALYVNGVLRGTSDTPYDPTGGGSTFLIGSNAAHDETMTGRIASIIAYDYVLSAAEIAQVTAYLNYKYFGGPVATLPVGNKSYTSSTAVDITNSNAALDVNGIRQSIGSLSGVAGSFVYLGDGQLTAGSANTDTTFAGSIRDAGGADLGTGGSFTKVGTGTTTLTGINTYSGGTAINAGVLAVNSNSALGSGGIAINGGTLRNTKDIVSSKTVTLGTSGGALDVSGGYLTFYNPVTGTGGLTKTGTRILTLTGAQSYIGATSIQGGTMRIDNGSLASSSVAISSGATLLFSTNGRYAGNITGAGALIREYSGSTVYTGAATHTGGTRVLSGTFQLGDGTTNGFLTGAIAIDSGATFAVNHTGSDATMANAFTGAGTFQKDGAGTVNFSGSNASFTGTTTINAGTLGLASNTALGTTGRITVVGGTLLVQQGVSISNAVTLEGGTYQRILTGSLVGAVNASSDLDNTDTTARILAGSATAPVTLTTSFSAADAAVANDILRQSDIYHFSKTGTDLYVLQLSVASTLREESFLGWKSGDAWVNAVDGNLFGTNNATADQLSFDGSFAFFQSRYGTDLSLYVGAYGMDTATSSTWAVLNHNSDYAIIPEPSTWALLVLGGLGLFLIRRRLSR